MSHKGSSANTNISLIENDAIINDQTGVATVLNDYYVNVTKSIGQPDLLDVNEDIDDVYLAHESHESVQYIKQYMIDQNGNNTKDFIIESRCHHPISIKCKIVGCKYRC